MKLKNLLLAIVLLMFLSCDDTKPVPKPEPVEATYTLTYSLAKLSEDFLDLGTFNIHYLNEKGQKQTKKITKSEIPYNLELKGLKKNSNIDMDFVIGKKADVELTKDKYRFEISLNYRIKGSDDKSKLGTIRDFSITIAKDKTNEYLEKLSNREYRIKGTIEELFK